MVLIIALSIAAAPPEPTGVTDAVEVVLALEAPPVAALAIGGATASEQRAAHRRLRAGQQPVVDELITRGHPIITRFTRTLNGVQTRIPLPATGRASLEPWMTRVGVVGIRPVVDMVPALSHSVPHVGGGSALEGTGFDGEGVTVGIIDSGVDYLHAAFGGLATPPAYVANDPATIEDTFGDAPLFPTARVVGGWDFAGEGYDGIGGPAPNPDPDPMPDVVQDDGDFEYHDHGTHVASIAAGSGGGDVFPGVAPAASIYALKVSSGGATALTAAAVEWASDPDGDGDLSDRLDVLNISLGTPFGRSSTDHKIASAAAIEAFVALGGVVVASQGNFGDIPFVGSSPAALPWTIAVANAHGPGTTTTRLEVLSPPALAGQHDARAANKKLAPSLSNTGPITGPLRWGNFGCEPENWSEPLDGAIAMVMRGNCKYVVKLQHAEAAGAMALVVVQNKPGEPAQMTGSPKGTIPAVMIAQAPGLEIAEALLDGEAIDARLADDYTITELVDEIRGGSSRGPGAAGGLAVSAQADDGEGDDAPGQASAAPDLISLAPDVTAPGTHIVAAMAGTGTEGRSKTGTSMAAPHVAGAAALLLQAHPDWTPRDVRAALMNTAAPSVTAKGEPAPLTRQGAGRLDVAAAVSTTLVARASDTVTADFGLRSFGAPDAVEATIVVRNLMDTPRTLSAHIEWRQQPQGVDAALGAAGLDLPPAGEAELPLTLTIDPHDLPQWRLKGPTPSATHTGISGSLTGSEVSGFVRLSDPTGQIRVPFYLLARSRPDVQTTTECLPPEPFELSLTNAGPPGEVSIFTHLGETPAHSAIERIGARWDDERLAITVVAREAVPERPRSPNPH